MNDEDRESLIDAAYDQMTQATSKSAQDQHWRDMCYHVRLRSPEQVLKMETERRIGEKFAPLFTFDSCDPQCDGDPAYGHPPGCRAKT